MKPEWNPRTRKDFASNSFTQRKVDKVFDFFSPQKNLSTIEHHPNQYFIEDLSHSWGTPLKHCLGAVFFDRGLVRNLIIWGTLHSKDSTWICFFTVNEAGFTQKKVYKRCCDFLSQKFLDTKEYHPNNFIIEDLIHSWGTTLKNCLRPVFEIRIQQGN